MFTIQGPPFDQEIVLTVAIRVALLVVLLLAGGCMPAKKAQGPSVEPAMPGTAEQGSGATSGAMTRGEPHDEDVDPVDVVCAEEQIPEAEALSEAEQKILDTDFSIHIGLDTEDNAEVQRYFHYYTHVHRGTMDGWLKRAQRYLPHIRERFLAEGLPEDLIYLPFAESGFNPFAVSPAGAGGMWQFMPATGKHYGLTVDNWVDERRDPYKSTEAAIKYLKKLYQDFGDWALVLAAYNAGEGAVGRALKKTGTTDYFSLCQASGDIKEETKRYVPKFLALVKIARNLEELGFHPLDLEAPSASYVALRAKPGTDLLGLARNMGLDWKAFRESNPTFRKQEAPPGRTVQVLVPGHLVAKAEDYLKRPVQPKKAIEYAVYRIKPGDSWWGVAQKHKVSVKDLMAVNAGSAKKPLQIGQKLQIPGQAAAAKAQVGSSAAPSATPREHIVTKGDTIWSLARQFRIDPDVLLKANGLEKTAVLQVGQKLAISSGSSQKSKAAQAVGNAGQRDQVSYQVRPGDSLWSIASRFGVTLTELREWNKLAENAKLRPGDQLRVYTR